jgi:transposase-like protein
MRPGFRAGVAAGRVASLLGLIGSRGHLTKGVYGIRHARREEAAAAAFTDEFKAEVVRKVLTGSETAGQVARDLDLTETAYTLDLQARGSSSAATVVNDDALPAPLAGREAGRGELARWAGTERAVRLRRAARAYAHRERGGGRAARALT